MPGEGRDGGTQIFASGLSANLTLQDYVRVARYSEANGGPPSSSVFRKRYAGVRTGLLLFDSDMARL